MAGYGRGICHFNSVKNPIKAARDDGLNSSLALCPTTARFGRCPSSKLAPASYAGRTFLHSQDRANFSSGSQCEELRLRKSGPLCRDERTTSDPAQLRRWATIRDRVHPKPEPTMPFSARDRPRVTNLLNHHTRAVSIRSGGWNAARVNCDYDRLGTYRCTGFGADIFRHGFISHFGASR